MQQTVDANVTKDQTMDAATTLVSGLSYFFYAVAEILGDVADADVTTTTAAYGSSSCYSSVVASATTEVVADVDVTTTASNF